MALIIDPIESDINSLLAPLTSVPTASDSGDDGQATSTTLATAASSTIIVTSTSSSESSSESSTKMTTTHKSTSSTHASSSSSASAKTSSSSTSSSSTPTTFLTSIVSSSKTTTADSSTSSSTSSTTTDLNTTTSSTTSAIPVPTPFPSAPSAAAASSSNTNTNSSASPAPISTAGIIIAIIFTVALIASILWLVARFCPPVRSRIDAWTARRRRERSYREAIDGPAVPAKDKDTGSEPYSASSERSYARDKHFSFFALGRNPPIIDTTASSRKSVVHQQFVSPDSASTPRGHGLGLGRVSLLRNHSLLRKAGHDVPDMPPQQEMHSMDSMMMTTTTTTVTPKSVAPAAPPVRQSIAKSKQLPVLAQQQQQHRQSSYTTRSGDRNGPLPKLHVDIPTSSMDANLGSLERVSQIGLAMTGTPGGHYGR